ncbi:hypothetical protein FNV43_RR22085 [Rhamnella rubrinervis]|uniref:Protein phosphatase n=1 Tax=Rhamnella rubrinervis TaxID=2594499 RepID=A0A8K0GS68_9ROSA|nr:hypothetical protein FNV43_RR22085 [Rhamnella rubrinervis]
MDEIGTNPLRARPLSFSSFHNLFLPSHFAFSKPLHNNTKMTHSRFRNVGAFEPIRFPKRNPSGVRILSKCASDSSSSSSDFGLLSATECSDGSVLFRFGNRDNETTLTRTDDEQNESASSEGLLNEQNELQFKERTELDNTLEQSKYHPVGMKRSDSAKVYSVDGGILESHSSVVNSKGKFESSESFLEETALDIRTSDSSCFKSDVDVDSSVDAAAVVDDGEKDTITREKAGPEVDDVLNEEFRSDENPAIISENDAITQLTSSTTGTSMQVLDMKTSDPSCSKSDVDEDFVGVVEDDDKDTVTSNGSKVDDVLNEGIGSDFEGNPAIVCENEGIIQLESSESEAGVEVLDGYTYHAISEENADTEDAYLTTVGNDESDDSTFKCATTDASDDDEARSSTVLDDNAPASTWEEQLTEGNTHQNDVAGLSIPGEVELNSIEGTPNRVETSTAGFVLSSGVAFLPHPSKALIGGENAHFVACQSWLGVADGVGHWSLEGTNSGLYGQELMENCERIVSDCKGIPMNKPEEVLITSAREAKSAGSSTVLVAYFDGQALHVANIGDSGFIIIRDGAVFQRSSPMHHEFNFPFQIERGVDPSKLIELYKIELDEGDVIITATDGLFDNLFEQEIASIVSRSLEANLEAQEIAECLANRAQEVGWSPRTRSPFADAAQAAGYVSCTGGKLDGVTVIVSVVQRNSRFHIYEPNADEEDKTLILDRGPREWSMKVWTPLVCGCNRRWHSKISHGAWSLELVMNSPVLKLSH